jgi:hypothetical protein
LKSTHECGRGTSGVRPLRCPGVQPPGRLHGLVRASCHKSKPITRTCKAQSVRKSARKSCSFPSFVRRLHVRSPSGCKGPRGSCRALSLLSMSCPTCPAHMVRWPVCSGFARVIVEPLGRQRSTDIPSLCLHTPHSWVMFWQLHSQAVVLRPSCHHFGICSGEHVHESPLRVGIGGWSGCGSNSGSTFTKQWVVEGVPRCSKQTTRVGRR